MKKLLLFYLITIFSISCKENSDNLLYSPISKVDLWVKNNLDIIAKMDRVDVLQYSKIYQRAIFVAKSPEQRFALWNDKYAEILKDLDLNDNQRNSIKELQSFLSVDIFKSDFNGKDDFLLKINNWANLAAEQDVFTLGEINQLVLSLESKLNTHEVINRTGGDPEPSKQCECNNNDSRGFIWDDCGELQKCKKCEGCITITFGCGPLYITPCDGLCLTQNQSCE